MPEGMAGPAAMTAGWDPHGLSLGLASFTARSSLLIPLKSASFPFRHISFGLNIIHVYSCANIQVLQVFPLGLLLDWGIEFRTLCLTVKCCATEIDPQPSAQSFVPDSHYNVL